MRVANPEHLHLLDSGAGAWNAWRQSEGIPPDFSGADLSRRPFTGLDLSHADLNGTNFRGSQFEQCWLKGAFGRDIQFQGARLSYTNCEGVQFDGADFSQAQFGDVFPSRSSRMFAFTRRFFRISSSKTRP